MVAPPPPFHDPHPVLPRSGSRDSVLSTACTFEKSMGVGPAPSAGEDDSLVEALRYGLKFFIVIPFAGVMFLILLKIGKMARQYLF